MSSAQPKLLLASSHESAPWPTQRPSSSRAPALPQPLCSPRCPSRPAHSSAKQSKTPNLPFPGLGASFQRCCSAQPGSLGREGACRSCLQFSLRLRACSPWAGSQSLQLGGGQGHLALGGGPQQAKQDGAGAPPAPSHSEHHCWGRAGGTGDQSPLPSCRTTRTPSAPRPCWLPAAPQPEVSGRLATRGGQSTAQGGRPRQPAHGRANPPPPRSLGSAVPGGMLRVPRRVTPTPSYLV